MKRIVLAALTIAALLAVCVSGCGRLAPTPPPPPEETPVAPADTPTPPPAPPEETSVVILVPEDPSVFNSLVTDTGYQQMLMELVLLGLTDIDPVGEFFLELAAEMPTIENGGVVVDEDAWTMDVTWTMRDDVYWADGEPVTADDVIFTWNGIADPVGGIWAEGRDYTESIERITTTRSSSTTIPSIPTIGSSSAERTSGSGPNTTATGRRAL